jgi:hypothetical protein
VEEDNQKKAEAIEKRKKEIQKKEDNLRQMVNGQQSCF